MRAAEAVLVAAGHRSSARRLVLAAAVTVLVPAVAAAQGSAVPIDAIMGAPFPSSMTAAPSGGLFAWVQSDEGVRNIWVAAPPDYRARQLTQYTTDDGRFEVIETLGEGGMGVVYLGERDDEQFRQQVAIKLVRHRLIDRETAGRLVSERQILADLDHPNIVPIYDLGANDEGALFYSMKRVRGSAISC